MQTAYTYIHTHKQASFATHQGSERILILQYACTSPTSHPPTNSACHLIPSLFSTLQVRPPFQLPPFPIRLQLPLQQRSFLRRQLRGRLLAAVASGGLLE